MTVNNCSMQSPIIQSRGPLNPAGLRVTLRNKFFSSPNNGSLLRLANIFATVLLIITQVTGVPGVYAAPIEAKTLSITSTFISSADAYVDASAADTNYGNTAELRISNSPIVRSYLRFDVQGLSGTVVKATLRIYATNDSTAGFIVNLNSDTSWDETSITFTNAPSLGTQVGSVGAFGAGVWTTVDVTPFITGNGPVSLTVTGMSDTAVSFVSREGGANAPQLEITANEGSTITPMVSPSATPVVSQVSTATPMATHTSLPTTLTTPVPTSINTLVAPPPPSSTTMSFVPSGDAFVHVSAPNTNFGRLAQIRVDNSPIIRSYLRFNVKGLSGGVKKATLWLFSQSVSRTGYNVYLSPDTGWVETSINYNNAPAVGGLAGSVGAFGSGVWTTVDITPFITGDGTLSLAIMGKNNSSINFVSREGGANAPQLVITTSTNIVIVSAIGQSATNTLSPTKLVPTSTSTYTSIPPTATSTATSTPTNTNIPPTVTPTDSVIVPTIGLSATNTLLPPNLVTTSMPIYTSNPPTSTSTATSTVTSTATSTATSTPTNTNIPPTATPSVPLSINGKLWYVDNAVSSSGDGTSWAKAWKGFSNIQWSLVQPGDTVYLSGGSSSKTYNEQLSVSKSGTSSARITIAGGIDAGHTGQVIIDGGETRSYCALTKGNYLTLSGLTCRHAIGSGIRIEGTSTILEKSIFSSISGQAIHLAGCDECIVRGNQITTDDSNSAQTDGIVIYGNSTKVVIENNWIKLTNQVGGHNDGIQANQDTDLTVRYNYVENTKNSTSDAQGIYATQMYGTVKYYGNIVVLPYGGQAVSNANLDIGTSHSVIINNVIKCGGYRCLYVDGDTSPLVKNNIVWQTGKSDVLLLSDKYGRGVSLANIPDSNIDGNLWYAPGGDGNIFDAFGQKNWSSWQREGFDAHGKNTDPGLDYCFRPTNNSPSLNAGQLGMYEYGLGLSMSLCGTNTSNEFMPVILTSRGAAWSIGAYDINNP